VSARHLAALPWHCGCERRSQRSYSPHRPTRAAARSACLHGFVSRGRSGAIPSTSTNPEMTGSATRIAMNLGTCSNRRLCRSACAARSIGVVVKRPLSSPQQIYIGWPVVSIKRTAVRSGWGQVSGALSDEPVQSRLRMIAPISTPPARKRGGICTRWPKRQSGIVTF
jgi:hypothetical protein